MRGRGFNHQMEEQDGAFHTHTARGLRIPIMFPIRFNHRKCTYNLDPSKTKKIQRPTGGILPWSNFWGLCQTAKYFWGQFCHSILNILQTVTGWTPWLWLNTTAQNHALRTSFPIEVLLLFETQSQDWLSVAERNCAFKITNHPNAKRYHAHFCDLPSKWTHQKRSFYSRQWVLVVFVMCRFQCLIMLRALARGLS